MNKQNYAELEQVIEDRKRQRAKKKTRRMKVSGKDVLKLAKIIRKKKK